MGGKALGNRVQVENGGAETGDIVHFLGNALEVAAVEVVVQDLPFGGGPPVHFLVPGLVDGVGFQLAGEVAVPGFMEPVGEDLVNGSTLSPVRGVEVRRNTAELPRFAGLHIGVVPFLEQPKAAVGGIDIEIVEVKSGVREGKLTAEDMVGTFALSQGQSNIPGVAPVFVVEDADDTGGLDCGGNVDMECTGLVRHQGTEGVLVHGLFAIVKDPHGNLLIYRLLSVCG